MISERVLLTVFFLAIGLTILFASFALRREPAGPTRQTVEGLSLSNQYFEPALEACTTAGGTVAYEYTQDCFNEPSVTDVCGFGVPCFTEQKGFYCRDAKRPYCFCASDDQCPDGFSCEYKRCARTVPGPVYPPRPYPL